MPSLKKMLKNESDKISNDPVVGKRTDATDLLISVKFKDGHIHHILPHENIANELTEDLLGQVDVDLKLPTENTTGVNKPPEEIIFKNRQALGDIFTMTCMVRDFKKAFPNVRVGVSTTAMHIWDNNPYIDHSFRVNDNRKILECGPGFLTNKSNVWNLHMCNAFRLDVQNKLGIRFQQGPIRPDIWMTEEEYNRSPLIDGPYWIFVYGGEPGWPCKQYHRWQEVIDLLKDDIKIVQLGVKNHPYPILENVIDYVGKTEDRNTGLRDLFNIFLHAQGSLGLVSMHMHLSAVFNNPCVVVAGAREPAWFTQYFGHQYIHTNGTMHCSETKACWACKMEGCKNKVSPSHTPTAGHHTPNQIPKCVDIIEPEEIADAVRKYYKGGRLEYGKKKPNTFFQNIVKEKKIFQVPKTTSVDEELLEKYGFKWGGGSITDRDWLFIKDIFKEYNVKKVIEFGCGLSTLLFGTMTDSVVSFETMPGWIDKIKNFVDESKHFIFHWDGKEIDINLDDFKETKFDLAFVDGPAGGQNREFSTKYGAGLADIVIVHDAGREWERKWQAKYLEQDFEMVAKGGHRCHLWVKKEIRKVQREEERVIIENDPRPSFRMVTTCRGYGGSERSSLHIMRMFQDDGYRVELIPTGNVSGEYRKNIPKDVIVRPWEDVGTEVDILTFYTSDTIWNFKKPQYKSYMTSLKAKRKVMILNYQLGEAGKTKWTLNWDLYMFLNSTKEGELLERIKNAKTKVLPPPTDLTEFFEVNVNYNGGLNLIRHNSQKDAKHPEYTNDLLQQIWSEINEDINFFYMPAYSKTFDDPRIHKFNVNQIPVSQFLSLGNCFWYHLPPGYQDQGPRVIIEAMACGLPCIGDNSYGAKDRITEETGWLCNDVSDYIEVIKEINEDLSILEKKGKAARERAKEHFVAENWHKAIKGE